MPRQAPPRDCPGDPARHRLPAGTRLYRVHGERFGVCDFNPNPPRGPLHGGRFDTLADDGPSFLYAALDPSAAVAETFLRRLPSPPNTSRLLPRKVLSGKLLGSLETGRPLHLVDLCGGENLSQVGQDSWLTKSEAADYPFTRRWAEAIRRWVPDAAGLLWRARFDEERFSCVLYAPPCDPDHLAPSPVSERLDRGHGLSRLRSILMRYNVAVS